MTLWQEVFIETLNDKDYSYEIVGNKIIVTEEGPVYLGALTSLPPGVEFRNRGFVSLYRLTSLPPGVVFKNAGDVNLGFLIGGWFDEWQGNIEGIDSNKLLNAMIKRELFI